MSITTHERHGIYPARFDGWTLNHIRSVTPSSAVQKALLYAGGSIDPQLSAMVHQDPTCRFTSGDVGDILANVNPTTGLAVATAAYIQFQQRADGGLFQGAGSHITLSALKGHLLIDEISAEHKADNGAEATLNFVALRVGANDPLTFNTGQSLLGTPALNAAYKLGPTVYEGSIVGGVQRHSVSFGLEFSTSSAGGATSPDVGSVVERAPTFAIEGKNLSVAADIGFKQKAIATGCTIYFAKVGANPADPVHLSFTIAAGDYEVQEVSGNGKDDSTARLLVTSAGQLITYSTTATIPS